MASSTLLKFKELATQSGRLLRPYEHAPWLLPAEVAMLVVNAMAEEPLAVVGGDVWVGSGHKSQICGDGSCEKTANESPLLFARRSMSVAIQRLQEALSIYGRAGVYVDLVVKDAMTGEPLIDIA
jgi:hypothetical protein